MIEKMKYVNITGPKEEIDAVTAAYFSKYEIHLENALTELTDIPNITPYLEINPYRDLLTYVNSVCADMPNKDKIVSRTMSPEEAASLIRKYQKNLAELNEEKDQLRKQHDDLLKPLRIIRHFRNLDFDVKKILHFQHISYRVGRIEKQYYQKLRTYTHDNVDTIFMESEENEDYVYGIYFAPKHRANQIHAIYSALHFETIQLNDVYDGTACEACDQLEALHKQLHKEMDTNLSLIRDLSSDQADELLSAQKALQTFADNFDIRKYAAVTTENEDGRDYFILCGWMTEKDARAFQEEVKDHSDIFVFSGEDSTPSSKTPPTQLKNAPLLKPFELYVRMYGLPKYGEMDPTWFLAITYSFIFGAMFGDVGQGLLLLIGGLALYKIKHMDLAGIIAGAGIFSTFFGFMYGSLFGFEDILPAIWLKPMSQMMSVPFVGKMNTVFVIAIGFGMLLILFCMILNIINSIRSNDPEGTWFDSNAVAGLVFYGTIVLCAFLLTSGHALPATGVILVMLILPLILMFLKEPLTNLVQKKAKIMPDQKAVFFVQSFFELFEVLLSYLSNTLSFLRIGAFAVSHAAMMEVVLMLAGAENGGSPNWAVIVLGNLFVAAMEGLIVGIQVLRLEYYELFSRFYKGGGREFRPFRKHQSTK